MLLSIAVRPLARVMLAPMIALSLTASALVVDATVNTQPAAADTQGEYRYVKGRSRLPWPGTADLRPSVDERLRHITQPLVLRINLCRLWNYISVCRNAPRNYPWNSRRDSMH